jgi:glycosyltransferase involved in cell wall biosynthesis
MVLFHLTRALVRLGHAVTVMSPTEGRLREDLEEAGADVIISPLALEAPYALDEVFEEFDAILPNTVLSWRVVLAAHAVGKPVIWLIQESYYGLTYVRAEAGAIQALVLADEVVFPSRETLKLYREFDSGNMSAELYGIDPPTVPHQRPSLRDGVLHIVTLGSVEPRKGQDVLVTAFRKLPRHVRDRCELHLVGRLLDETFVDTLRGVARCLPVRLHGEVSPGEALALLDESDVLVCPSRDETGPLVVMEAMALGKPVISTEVGAVPELIEDGANGLLVAPGEVPLLVSAIERIVLDAGLRERLGRAAKVTYDEQLTNERYGRAFTSRIVDAIERTRCASSSSASLEGRRL